LKGFTNPDIVGDKPSSHVIIAIPTVKEPENAIYLMWKEWYFNSGYPYFLVMPASFGIEFEKGSTPLPSFFVEL
jgi:hypothetical protein